MRNGISRNLYMRILKGPMADPEGLGSTATQEVRFHDVGPCACAKEVYAVEALLQQYDPR
jgi:hypothetical protein